MKQQRQDGTQSDDSKMLTDSMDSTAEGFFTPRVLEGGPSGNVVSSDTVSIPKPLRGLLQYRELSAWFGENSDFSWHMLASDLASLYSGEQDVDAVVSTHYEDDAVFEDPLVSVQGQKYLAAHFKGRQWMCPRVQFETQTVTHGTYNDPITYCNFSYAENSEGDFHDATVMVIDAVLTFYLIFLFPVMIRIHTVCTLSEETGKISRHVDFWDVRSMFENIPLVGKAYCSFRELLGYVSSKLIFCLVSIVMWMRGKSEEKKI